MPSATATPVSTVSEYKEALAGIWIDDDQYKIGGISVVRECSPEGADEYVKCELTIKSSGRLIERFQVEDGRKDWLKYGILNLLGKNSQQLIVLSYSGGSHCCYDYSIYDLEPKFRRIYSTPFDSSNVVGNQLVPVDIDGDGVQEFYQDVMAFDYWGEGGHADASFPPAIFAYDKNIQRYTIANKRFPNFVLAQLEVLSLLAERGEWTDQDTENEYLVRARFLYLVYAGQREAAWKYFDENYRSSNGNGYQEQFKQQFQLDASEIFAKDPVYLSIYGRGRLTTK